MNTPIQELAAEQAVEPRKRTVWFPVAVFLIALVGAFSFCLAMDRLHWKADRAESNFQYFMLRLCDYLYGKSSATAVLTGSSFTVEIDTAYFNRKGIYNLAIPGCNPQVGCMVLSKFDPVPPFLFIEENTAGKEFGAQESLVMDACNSPQLWMAEKLPFLRAAYRPSSIFYSFARKMAPKKVEMLVPVAGSTAPELKPPLSKEFLEVIHGLSARGTKVIFYRLPSGSRSRLVPSRLEQVLGPDVEFIDIASEFQAMGYTPLYCDTSHLAPPSAKVVAQFLERALEKHLAGK